MNTFSYLNATVIDGEGALDELRTCGVGDRVLLVTGSHVRSDSALSGRLEDILGKRLAAWETVAPFPSEEGVNRVLERAHQTGADSIIAVGGGSVLDAAKISSVLVSGTLTLRDVMDGKLGEASRNTRLIAAPTLAGSGSEVTPFAVLYAGGKKYSLESPLFQPDLVLSDPSLVLLPPAPAASAAMLDALSQAIESLWAVRATPESEEHAWSCLQGIRKFFSEPDPVAQCAVLAKVSLESGMAIGISRTTAAHALSYPLTIRFRVPHGVACASLLPAVILWNAGVGDDDCAHPRGAEFVRRRIREIESVLSGEIGLAVRNAAESLRVSLLLGDWGIKESDVPALSAACGNPERLGNNPRRLPLEIIRSLYEQSL